MRALSSMIVLSLAAAACAKREAPPALPESEAPAVASEPVVEAPTHATAAFVPPEQGSCERSYRLVEDTCVHRFYEPGSELALKAALASYKRGVAPPMLGPVQVARKPEPRPAGKPDPGALMRKSASTADAGSTRDQRLAELDAMLAVAREKLRMRDEQSKAKKVENAPRAARPAQGDAGDREALDRFARSMNPTPGAGGAAATGDPTAARMSELANIANQLSSEQLKALTAELSNSGINASALEQVLQEAHIETK